jgi:hypothetical protein
MENKICNVCLEKLPIEDFYFNSTFNTPQNPCKKCRKSKLKIVSNNSKGCLTCLQKKPLNSFYKLHSGYQKTCIECNTKKYEESNITGKRKCYGCNTEKNVIEFYLYNNKLHYPCNQCKSERTALKKEDSRNPIVEIDGQIKTLRNKYIRTRWLDAIIKYDNYIIYCKDVKADDVKLIKKLGFGFVLKDEPDLNFFK